ncbi:unnamed protein product [Effrenium voratum]|nr:unnamed protein product [Effrenium voratum]
MPTESRSVVLEEHVDSEYEPTEQEILDYSEWLGMDVEKDKDLMWIARAGLKVPLPPPWKPCTTGEEGEVFYFNFETGESVWDHPCDEFHRLLYKKERAKKPRPQTHSDRTFRDACVVRAGRRPRRCSEAFSARAFSARREGHTMGGTAEAARACCLLLMSLNMRSLNYTL